MSARKKLPYVVLGIVALAPGIVASCGSNSDSAVIVHVTGPTTLPAVFRIHSILSNDETSDSKLFPMTAPAQAIAIPTAFSITLPRARSGELDVALDALDATGDILANGAGSTTINAGGTAEVIIPLSLGISLCGNGQIDPGEQCDDGDRITNGTCDYRCQKHVVVRGNDGGSSDAIDGGMGTGGAGAGGKGGAGGGGAGAGGKLGTGGTGAGGAGLGGMTGAGGRGMGGSGAGGSGVGGGSGGCAIELLSNGTFDDGPIGWSFTSPVNTVMIYSSGDPALGGVSPASGTGVALLGRNLVNNGGSTTPAQETMAQVISVPSAANTITIQGLVQIPTATTTCTTCNSVAAEIVHNPTNISVKSWTAGDGTGAWMGFGTTIDATPLRGTTVLFQLRAVATTTNVVPFYFDSLSAKVDKCGP